MLLYKNFQYTDEVFNLLCSELGFNEFINHYKYDNVEILIMSLKFLRSYWKSLLLHKLNIISCL